MQVSDEPALDLPRLVMRRAALVALAMLVLTFVLGFVRAGADIRDENRAALALATLVAAFSRASEASDTELVAMLERARSDGALRHINVRIVDARGVTRLEPEPVVHTPDMLDLLVALHARWQTGVPERSLALPVARLAEASPWRLVLTESREGERREAMAGLAWALALAAALAVAMLAVMAFNVRRAFVPLRQLVAHIHRMRAPGAFRFAEALPDMPIRELQVVAQAVQRLDEGLLAAEAERRSLSHKMLTLQEDERARLARELHDELGQRLTALRVDVAWLDKRLLHDATASPVVQGMATHCEQLQKDVRTMLHELHPMAVAGAGVEPLAQLPALLAPLVESWSQRAPDGIRLRLDVEAEDAEGQPLPWPTGPVPTMPRELQLAIYRMTQEALTNIARHAQAHQARVQLSLHIAQPSSLRWSVEDDGIGVGDSSLAQQRGSGLAGMRERAWAHGTELQTGAAREGDVDESDTRDGGMRPGFRVAVSFRLVAPTGAAALGSVGPTRQAAAAP